MTSESQFKVKATAMEKLDCVVGVTSVLLRTVLFSAMKYPFVSKATSQRTLGREIVRLLVRRLDERLNIAQLQWLLPKTHAVYESWIASKASAEDAPIDIFTEIIGDDGAKLHWVGRKDATKVILHFHGGGFVTTLSPGHLNFISFIRKEVKRRSGVEVKTAFLEYSLLPVHKYLTQFRQATLALQHIIDSGISPSDIVISGDSAGGQLALQILSHILHPHPNIPRIRTPKPTTPLAGIITLPPWVIFDSAAPSLVNDTADILVGTTLLRWGRLMTDGTAISNGKVEADGFWGEPLKAPPRWWHEAAEATQGLMVVYGAREVFLDDNVAFVQRILESVAGTKVDITNLEEPEGIHNGPVFDALVGRAPNEVSKIIAGWVNERLTK